MARQLYDYWFVQFDFPDENGRPYKSSGGKMVWNDALKKNLPSGWGVNYIKGIAKTHSGGTPKSTKREYYESGTIPWINSGELNYPFITQTKNFITQAGLENSSAKLYPANTILVAMYGATSGKVSLLTFEACSNQAICGIMPFDNDMTDYVRFYISSLYEQFLTLSSGSARDNISQDTLRHTLIIVPEMQTLREFSQQSGLITQKIIQSQREIDYLTKLRDELLPLLMNGQVTLNYDLENG